MIDWFNLGANSLWILGSALALAGLSYASWGARQQGIRLRQQLRQGPYQILFSLAGVLFCLGLAGTAASSLEIALWLLLAAAFTAQTGFIWRYSR